MKNNLIYKRLDTISSLCNKSKILVDFGCDHGYVLKKAFLDYKIKKGIAIDNKEEPLKVAKKNLVGFDVIFLKKDSFENFNYDFDTCVVTGLGHKTIINILKFAPTKKTYIISSNTDVPEVRKFLEENNFKIKKEKIVFENGKFYIIIKTYKTLKKYKQKNYYSNKYLKNNLLYKDYKKQFVEKLENLKSKVSPSQKKELERIISCFGI